MRAKVYIKNLETNETLEYLGEYLYDSTNRLFSNLNDWHCVELEKYLEQGLFADIVLEDIPETS